MSDSKPIHRWLLTGWKQLLALVIGCFVALGIAGLSVTSFDSHDWRANAIWPARLSADVETVIPITLYGYDDDIEFGGTVEVYHGWHERRLGAPAAFESDHTERVGSAEISSDGTAVVRFEPAEDWFDHSDESSGPTEEQLIMRVENDGDVRWYARTLQGVDAPIVALTLDRPLYQPGQTINMRALVASAVTGRPVDGEVTFRVRDPRSNLVFEETVDPGGDGVAPTEFELADRCVQGTYSIEVTRESGERAQKSIDVRPFRLPRFQVRVVPDGEEVQPGEMVSGRVETMYTYGEPVTGGTVALEGAVGEISLPSVAGETDETGNFGFEIPVPRNAPKGASIRLEATVTSAAGRAESGAGTASVAGRTAKLELVASRKPHLLWGREQRVYAIATDAGGSPIEGARLTLVLPESGTERTEELVTDEHGRAAFDWTPDSQAGAYVSARVVVDGEVLLDRNLHPTIQHGSKELRVDASVLETGGTVEVGLSREPAIVALVRDNVALSAVRSEGAESVELPVPDAAAGHAQVVLMRDGNATEAVGLWVKRKGGETVDINLDQAEYEPGSQAKVTLSFPPGETEEGVAPVTFGLVGVDEALYALKERADVPLHILMRRAPDVIDAALSAFDGVAADDEDGQAIAISRFRSTLGGNQPRFSNGSDVTGEFSRHQRRPFQFVLLVLFLFGALGVAFQMTRWTWSITERSIFGWRRLAAQVGFVVFCGLFAIALATGGGEAWAGGLAVWLTIVLCWLVAAAARLPEIPMSKWLAAHLLGAAFLGSAGILMGELSRGPGLSFEWLFGILIGVPIVLTGLQWIAWSFVLLREGETQSGLALASFFGIFTLGLTGFLVTGGQSIAPDMAPAKFAESEEMPGVGGLAMDGARRQALAKAKPGAPPPPGGAAAAAQPRVRSWFPETMVWLPEVASNKDGEATVNVEVPDSITTWRLDAWANTQDGRFGHGRAPLLAIQPYFVQLDMPTDVISGDRFEVPVTLVNRSGDPLTVDVTASAEGALAVRGGVRGTRELAPGDRSVVWIQLAAVDVGEGHVTVTSTTAEGVKGDAVRRTLRVHPDGRVLRDSSSAIVGEGWETTVVTPVDTIRNTRISEVRLYASLVANALSGLQGMLRQPSGCFEQTSSANYPNVMILRALRDTEPSDWPDGEEAWAEAHEDASKFVELGYQRILTFQRPGGGFALYPDRYEADVMLTAYGILQLVWAKEVTTVDPGVIQRAARWLVSQQNSDGSWPAKRRGLSGSSSNDADIGRVRSTAFVVMALAATEDQAYRPNIERALVRMEDRIDSVESANALAFAANAFSDAGAKEAGKKAVDRLASMAKREGDVAYWTDSHPTWMGGHSTYAARETTAVAAQALISAESEAELIQPVLNYIAGNRGPWGGWGSTQTTVWTLRTLESLRDRTADESTLRFYWNSEQLETVGGKQALHVTKEPQPMRQFSFVPERSEGRFVVDASAETTATVQLVTEYAAPWDSRSAEVDGEPFGGEVELEERALTRGERVRAYARLENVMQNDVSMVIVEMPVPPGAFVPTDPLDALVEKGGVDMYEVLPTHIRLYVSGIPMKGERVFAYDFVPLVGGTFSLPPLRAYPFYSPEPTTEVDAGDVRVR